MSIPPSVSSLTQGAGSSCSLTSSTAYGKSTTSQGGSGAAMSRHQSPSLLGAPLSLTILRSVSMEILTALLVASWYAERMYCVRTMGTCFFASLPQEALDARQQGAALV